MPRKPSLLSRLTLPAGLSSGRKYIEECESLRGWAVLGVFVFHLARVADGLDGRPSRPIAEPSLLSGFLLNGTTYVMLFFSLSAFLLAMPYFRGRAKPAGTFYRNRLLRIMPLYVVAVAVGAIYNRNLLEGLRALFFLNPRLNVLPPFGGVWWSLAAEMQFYLILPPLMAILYARRRRVAGLVVLSIAAAVYAALELAGPEITRDPAGPGRLVSHGLLMKTLVGFWPTFFFGTVASWVYVRFGTAIRAFACSRACLRRGGSDLLLVLVLFAIGKVLQEVTAMGLIFAELTWRVHHNIEGLLWTLVLLIVVLLPLRCSALVVNPITNFLGIIAYSVYLVHLPLIVLAGSYAHSFAPSWFTEPGFPLVGFFLLMSLATVAISLATYLGIERPFLLRKERPYD